MTTAISLSGNGNNQQQDNTPTIMPNNQVAALEDFTLAPEAIIARKQTLALVMDKVMKKGTHYGTIPGCGDKPTLLKPGAEAVSSTFQLCPRYQINRTDLSAGHREYEITCELYAPNGSFVGSGVGSCSTMEGKYRFRRAGHKCPACKKEDTIIKGKQQYGGGWVCYKNKGGCGAKFNDGDPQIENQDIGRVEHDNPADYYNTVLKMGKKRAFVDAVLTVTGASDIFTQDIEDMGEVISGARQQGQQQTQHQSRQGNAMDQMDGMPSDYGQQSTGQNGQANGNLLSEPQKRKIFGSCKGKGIDLNALCQALTDSNSFGGPVTRIDNISKQDASTLIGWLEDGSLDHLGRQAA